MSRILLGCLLVMVIQSIAAQNSDEECSFDTENMSADQIINEANPNWSFGCLNKRLIKETIASKAHIKGIIDCLHPDTPVCVKKGYKVMADEIIKRTDGSGQCPTCSPRAAALVEYALKLLQQRHPRELRRALSYLG